MKPVQVLCPSRFSLKGRHERFLDDTQRITGTCQGRGDRVEGIADLATLFLLVAHWKYVGMLCGGEQEG
jgi:hypothetical protein